MSDEPDPEEESEPKKKGMLIPLIAGIVLAIVGGGGGFWAVTSGPLAAMFGNASEESAEDGNDEGSDDMPDEEAAGYADDVAYVPLNTVTIPLALGGNARHLIFSAQLEVPPEFSEEVGLLTPRVLDVLNSYLRVVSIDELSNPTSLARLRAQMLHRIQIVTGEGRVRDLLITEFVVN